MLISILRKGSVSIDIWLAKKFLFPSGPVGIWIKIHLNPKENFKGECNDYRRLLTYYQAEINLTDTIGLPSLWR
jgi:hypothetical protein